MEWDIKDQILVLRRDAGPMNHGNDGTVPGTGVSFLEGLDRYILAELSAQLLALVANRSCFTAINCQSQYPVGILTP